MNRAPRRALVTGGGRGLGLSLVHALLSQGYQVSICSRTSMSNLQVVSGNTFANSVTWHYADLSSLHSIENLLASWGRSQFDLVVNNAGAVYWEPGVSEEGFERTVALNYLGPVHLTTRLLEQSWPLQVVNIGSSIMLKGPVPDVWWEQGSVKAYEMGVRYALSKTLLAAFTASLLDQNVHARCIHPGLLQTQLGLGPGLLSRLGHSLTSMFGRKPDSVAAAVIEQGLTGRQHSHGYHGLFGRPPELSYVVTEVDARSALMQLTQKLISSALERESG